MIVLAGGGTCPIGEIGLSGGIALGTESLHSAITIDGGVTLEGAADLNDCWDLPVTTRAEVSLGTLHIGSAVRSGVDAVDLGTLELDLALRVAIGYGTAAFGLEVPLGAVVRIRRTEVRVRDTTSVAVAPVGLFAVGLGGYAVLGDFRLTLRGLALVPSRSEIAVTLGALYRI